MSGFAFLIYRDIFICLHFGGCRKSCPVSIGIVKKKIFDAAFNDDYIKESYGN
jgi:hypothetical protein